VDEAIKIINTLGAIVPVLLAVGAGWKYLPVVRNVTNEVIPLLNALIAFLMAFGGGATVAHAGLLGDIGKALSLPGQIAASVLLSYLTAVIHDKFLKGLTPPSPAGSLVK
jgi:hypothetical protein